MADFDSIEQHIRALRDRTRMGRAFERVVAHYLRHDPTVGVLDVWLWDDWPDRIRLGLKADQGIDLVAIDGESRLTAVQVKFHSDPDRDVTQREVATLFSIRPDLFDRWFIVSNAIGHGPNAERATAGRGDVTWVHRDALIDSTIDWSGALEAVSGKAEPQFESRHPREPEQVEAISDTVAALEEHERVQLIMACGTGKTLVTRWITEARRDRLVLVLVPTLLLLKQFRTQWREHARHSFIDLGVCSDADTMEKDEWTVHPDELGVRVTTDPADIATFLKGDGRRVIFGTYASSARIAEAQADSSVPAFDLVVADEGHRVAGVTSRGNAMWRDTKVVLDGDRIRASRRLFATATPRVYARNIRARLEGYKDVEFASMDDVAHFGIEGYRLWFRRAVDLGRLVDYRLHVVRVTDSEVEAHIRDRAIVDVQGHTFDAATLASLIAMRRAVAELGITRAITFHHTIRRAHDFALELERLDLDAPSVNAEHISGSMSMADRQRVLARLREPEQPTIVTNARCLTEGIDVPSLDAIAFVDPRSAPVDIVQAVGRVMRTAPGKELGHVIVPVFMREEQLDPEAAIESSTFEPVLAVLRALRAHDPELVTDATRIATRLGRRDAHVGGYISDHIQVLGAAVDVSAFERAIHMRFVEVTADPFEVGLAHLRSFHELRGHASVPVTYRDPGDEYPTGSWARTQRGRRKRGELTTAQVAALDALGYPWDGHEVRFQEGLGYLWAFAKRSGHARVPQDWIEDGFTLGEWVSNRRAEHDMLVAKSPDRAAALEAVPYWIWEIDPWEDGIAALKAYRELTGRVDPPRDEVISVPFKPDGFPVGAWLGNQLSAYRREELPPERKRELEGLGVTFERRLPGPRRGQRTPKKLENWHVFMTHLRAFREREGHLSVLQSWIEDRYPLGVRVSFYRGKRRRGELEPWQIEELDELGFSWEGSETLTCQSCGKDFERLRRGRRPSLCPACRRQEALARR